MLRLAAGLVGAVFLASGALKFRDPGWPAAARSLGTPKSLVPLIAPGELVVGALLLVGFGTRIAAPVASALLVIFTGVLVRALRAGDAPECACFGALSSRPIGPWSVVRNLVLLTLSVAASF